MSFVTRLAGIDPLIAAVRKEDWYLAKQELISLVRKYCGEDKAAKLAIVLVIADVMDGKK